MSRKSELQKMKVIGELDRIANGYGLDIGHMRKSEIIEAILDHENPPKKTRPPRNHAQTNLKAVRVASGMAQREVAEAAEMNVRTLQHYEQGSKLIDSAKLETILRLCIALKCDISDIVESEELAELYKTIKTAQE